MNIVIVAPRFPFPLDEGDRLTIYHMLRHFSERHTVSLVCFLEPGQKHEWGDIVAPFCAQVVVVPLNKMRSYANCVTGVMSHRPLQVQYYMDPAMKDAVRQVVEAQQPDLLYAHTISSGR